MVNANGTRMDPHPKLQIAPAATRKVAMPTHAAYTLIPRERVFLSMPVTPSRKVQSDL